jgi:hypothetical protein
MINVVMTRVPRGLEGADGKGRDFDNIVILENADTIRRDRREFSPEPFHLVAVKTRGGGDEFRRVDEMRGSAGMNVDRRAELGEAPGRSGVIEMDVTEKDVANVARREAESGKLVRDAGKRRFRAGIEKHRAIVRLEHGCRDDAAPAEMLGVENVDHDDDSPLGARLGCGFFGAVPRAVRGSYLSMVSQCFWRTAKNGKLTTVFAVALLRRNSLGPRDGSRT